MALAVIGVLCLTVWQGGPAVALGWRVGPLVVPDLPAWMPILVAAVICWIAFTTIHHRGIAHPRIGYIETRHEPFALTREEIDRWRDGLSDDQKSYLLDLVCRPTRYIRRIKETVRFISTSIEIETSSVIDELEHEQSTSYLVPVHWQAKGTEVDGMQVSGAGSGRLSTLVARDTTCAMVAIAFDLVDRMVADGAIPANQVHDLQAFALATISDGSAETALSRYLKNFDPKEGALAGVSTDTDSGRQFRVLTGRLTENYPIVVSADALPTAIASPGNASTASVSVVRRGRRITVRHIEVPVALQKTEVQKGFRSWIPRLERALERALFIEPPRIIRSIENADRARSYHLTVTAPAGLYFYNMRFGHLRSTINASGMAASAPESHASGRNLQDFGHLYLRDATRAAGYYAVTTFRERLPGSITEAMLVAGLMTLLIGAVDLGHGGTISSFFSVLVPVIFATVGTGTIWRSINQINEAYPGRLASRVSSLASFAIAMLAVFQSASDSVLIAQCAPTCATWDYSPWGWLLALAVANLVFAIGVWRVDLLVERDFRSANPARSLAMEVGSRVEASE
ncbi:MAG TPA: hypothetical protein VHZ81_09635 [Galbitalea sp.]|nr:hypothetical protein [Galbitalea sp.]